LTQLSVVIWWQKSKIVGEQQMVIQLTSRTHRDSDKTCEFCRWFVVRTPQLDWHLLTSRLDVVAMSDHRIPLLESYDSSDRVPRSACALCSKHPNHVVPHTITLPQQRWQPRAKSQEPQANAAADLRFTDSSSPSSRHAQAPSRDFPSN
jgi:hypothetical protein